MCKNKKNPTYLYLDHTLPVGHFSGAHCTLYESNACLENLPPRLKYCSLLIWFEARMG